MPRAPIGPRKLEAELELSAILFAHVVMFSAVALLNKELTRQYCDIGYLQSVEELNLGPPNTNPSSGREEDFNSGPRITNPAP